MGESFGARGTCNRKTRRETRETRKTHGYLSASLSYAHTKRSPSLVSLRGEVERSFFCFVRRKKESARCISNKAVLTSQVVTTPGKVRMTQSWEGMESRKTTVAMPCSWKRRFVTDSSVRCLVFSQFNYLSPLVPPLESLRARA